MSHISVPLYPHQKKGVAWMIARETHFTGGILADDMGLGKSIQTLGVIVNHPSTNPARRTTLVVVPLALVHQWREEVISKVALPLKVGLYLGGARKSLNFAEYDIVVTTYSTLSRDHPPVKKKPNFNGMPYFSEKRFNKVDKSLLGRALRFQWYRVVLDECQFVKNHESLSFTAVYSLDAVYRWCLSGTPVQNCLAEATSVLGFLRIPYEMRDFHGPFKTAMLRRTKAEVLTLPKKVEKVIKLTLDTHERKIYNELKEEIEEQIVDLLGGNIREGMAQILVLLTRWRQICDHPALIGASSVKWSLKQQRICFLVEDLLKKTADGKIVIFSSFVGFLKRLQEVFLMAGYQCLIYDGSLSMNDRDEVLKTFREAGGARILLMSTKAGNVGLNLTVANSVILSEPWWNPFVDEQAIDRVYRIGQTKKVKVFRFLVEDTIETAIKGLQDNKKYLVENLMKGQKVENVKLGISIEEIRRLVRAH